MVALAAQFVITQVTQLLTFLKVWPARTLVVAGSKVDESEYGRVSVILSVLGNSRHGGGLVKTCVRTDSPIALVHNAFANQDPEDDIDGPTYHGSGSGGVTGGAGSKGQTSCNLGCCRVQIKVWWRQRGWSQIMGIILRRLHWQFLLGCFSYD